jgi:hypothetical protein
MPPFRRQYGQALKRLRHWAFASVIRSSNSFPHPGFWQLAVKTTDFKPGVIAADVAALKARNRQRDYAGIVVEGPAQWIGAEVWGTVGKLG